MADPPASRSTRSERFLIRILLGLVVLLLAYIVLQWVLGWIFALVRIALLLGLLAVVGWFVLIGPPGSDE